MSAVLEALPSVESSLPESDQLYEIVYGKRVEKHVSAYAGWIAGELIDHLNGFLRRTRLGKAFPEVVFILDEERNLRRRPDVAYLSVEKWPLGEPPPRPGDLAIIPDLAIEVISPGNRYGDMLGKIREYFRHGVQEVWVVAPDQRVVQVFSSPSELREVLVGEQLTSTLLPGFSVDVEMLLPHEAVPVPNDA